MMKDTEKIEDKEGKQLLLFSVLFLHDPNLVVRRYVLAGGIQYEGQVLGSWNHNE